MELKKYLSFGITEDEKSKFKKKKCKEEKSPEKK